MWVFKNEKFNKLDFLLGGFLFVFLWTYLFLRANFVDLIHDEIASKWIYMIRWNYLPYEGYIDANNHFVNSFLGGLFYRIFNSYDAGIIRLGSLISFPLYFFSTYSLSRFFQLKSAFYLLVTALLCSAFLIEYFALARGYGISLAFMLLASSQTLIFLKDQLKWRLGLISLGWTIAIYSNLTLLPVALFSLVFLMAYLINFKSYKQLLILAVPILPVLYAIKYSFYLKEIGKLYYGAQDGFFTTTVHSLTPYLWNVTANWLDMLVVVLSLFIFGFFVLSLKKERTVFSPRVFLPLLFVIAIINIFAQNILLGINFPEDRAALYLVVLFLGSLAFTFDHFRLHKLSVSVAVVLLFLFVGDLNLRYSKFYTMDHYDAELVNKISVAVQGIPPVIGARKKSIINDLALTKHLPLKAYQMCEGEQDTLADYILIEEGNRPTISNLYESVHTDQISNVSLWKRKQLLNRTLVDSLNFNEFSTNNEFFEFYTTVNPFPVFVRCSGTLENWNVLNNVVLVVTSDRPGSVLQYDGVNFSESTFINENKEVTFDFTVCIPNYPGKEVNKVYLWNRDQLKIDGNFQFEIYQVK